VADRAVDPRRSTGRPDASVPLREVVGSDLHVPVVRGADRRLIHLDYAASAPALRSVADAVNDFLPWYSSVHRGAGFTSTVSSELLEASRDTIRTFVGGRADDTVIVTRNTTDALNLLARSLPAGTTVLTLDIEHHANLLPWRHGSVRHLPTPSAIDDVPEAFDSALRAVATPHALVAVTGASNVTGEVMPLERIAAVAKRYGARVVVDAAQLAPHRRIDMAASGIDYLAFSGHKMYAPFGAGALVGRRDWLDAAPPHLAGGGAVQRVTLDDVGWAGSPARHEAGTPNVVGAVAIAAACRALDRIGFDAVERHDAELTAQLLDGIATITGATPVDAFGPASDRVGIVTIHTDRAAAVVAAALSAEDGIATRDGAFCAHPLLRRLLSAPPQGPVPNALRVSVGAGSTSGDIEVFLDALARLTVAGPSWNYDASTGRPRPDPDPRPSPMLGGSVRP
jgi:selenocysteine lyase/cysteine desulfurase